MKKKKYFLFTAGYTLLYACFLIVWLSQSVAAQTLPANFQRVLVTGGLNGPTAMDFTPDGRVLICQQNGQLRVVKNGTLLATPALSLSVNTSGERGLIGIAVDPNFASNQYIYVYYTHTSGPHNRVSRFTMSGDVAGAEQVLLDLPTLSAIYHNGGGLSFGKDGKLYVSVGDNKVGADAQNLDSYMGKVLRINPDGTVPSGNPFSGGAARSRVWAYGLRNPFTNAADLVGGKFFVDDVGESTWEEINDATTGGRNFAWPNKEGNCTSGCTGYTNPVYVYQTNRSSPPANGQGCAINGGTFFNSAISNYPAVYNGKYFFLDYCGAWIDYINPASPSRVSFATGLGDGLTYIKQGPDGNLYYLRRTNNSLYRIIYTGTHAPVITSQPQSLSIPQGQTASFSVTATGTPAPTYQWRKNGTTITGATASVYTITNVQPSHAGQYSVVATNSAGSVTSANATLTVTQPNTLPVASITSPLQGALFRAGDGISFSGSATDAEDGSLPASAFEWWVDFHHANHTHPGPEISDGATSGSFPISAQGHIETDIWYRLYLAVTDSQGGTDTTYVEIFPVTSNLTLTTQPSGLQVRLDDIPFTTPYTTEALSGMTRPLAAISPQTLNGTTYVFDHWSHGGAASQNITITDNDATYTAHYRVAPPPVTIAPAQDAYVRNGTYAGTTHGTTDPALLITKLAPTGQADNGRESYLSFNLSGINGGVASVVLKVYGRIDDTQTTNVPVSVFSVANTTWSESTITWNNKPATSASSLRTTTVTDGTFRYYDWDVTDYVRSELSAGRTSVSFAMKSEVAHNPRIFWNSKEAGSNPPQLSVIVDSTGNVAPAVSITSPANGATFAAPASVTINVTATDSDGAVAKVEFFQGATKLGEDLTSPYSFSWTNVAAGSYSLTASATDDDGAIQTSGVVNITVQAAPACEPVTASSDDGNVPANVLDGNLSTRWSANGDGQWIQFCLDTEKTVSGVQIAFYNGNVRTSTFDVLTSFNGTDWTTAATGLTSSGTSLNLESFSFTERTAKHVRIVGHGNSVNGWNSYTEVLITIQTPATCTAPVTASANDGNVPANVLDNNLNTRWSASGDGQWIQLCLDGEKTVSGVQIAFYNGNVRTSAFDVQTSLNGTSWSAAATGLVSSGTSLNLETFTFTARTAKYVRIVGHGNSVNAWNSYTEVKISTATSLARIEESSSESFSVSSYPNPSAGQITVQYNLKEAGPVRISIHNTVSNQTTILLDDQQSAGEYQSAFDVSNLPEGVYVVKLINNGMVKTQRVVKR